MRTQWALMLEPRCWPLGQLPLSLLSVYSDVQLTEFKVFEKFAKNENTAFCVIKYAKNIRKIGKVLGIRIETIYRSKTRGKLSIRALPFFYPTKVSHFSSILKGFVDRQRMALSSPHDNGENCVVLQA